MQDLCLSSWLVTHAERNQNLIYACQVYEQEIETLVTKKKVACTAVDFENEMLVTNNYNCLSNYFGVKMASLKLREDRAIYLRHMFNCAYNKILKMYYKPF